LAHYDQTAEEILDQCDGKLDYLVMGVGTGGTIAGISRKIKEKHPECVIVGVDPHGSILAIPDTLNTIQGSYHVEGTGYDFIPRVLDRTAIDHWIKSDDKNSFTYARRLIAQEGCLCGGSAGGSMWAAMKFAKENNLGPDKRMVVLLADSVRNYITKFINDSWMRDLGFLDMEGDQRIAGDKTVRDLGLSAVPAVTPETDIGSVLKLMTEHKVNGIPVESEGKITRFAELDNLIKKVSKGTASKTEEVKGSVTGNFKTVTMDTSLAHLAVFLDVRKFALVEDNGERFVVTHADLAGFYADN